MASGTVNTGTKLVLLWANSSPTSSFAAQTISVNLNAYDLCAIETRFATNSDNIIPLYIFKVDENRHVVPITGTSVNRTGGRGFTYSIANQAITFETGYYGESPGGGYAIPIGIYGIKL